MLYTKLYALCIDVKIRYATTLDIKKPYLLEFDRVLILYDTLRYRYMVEQEVLNQVSTLMMKQENRCPSVIMASRELLAQVVFLLTNELEEKPRNAFYMARIEGFTYREIAKHLDVSESSVKQYLAKVMIHCHNRLYSDKNHL